MLLERSILYAENVIRGTEKAPPEVKWECERFLKNLKLQKEDEFEYYFDEEIISNIEELLKIINMATGIGVVGKSVYDVLADFQCFFLTNVFGWREKKDTRVFKHKEITLFIPRKNAKTFICALCFLILMLTEPQYSEFYSICLDRELAGLVKNTISKLVLSSPEIEPYFKLSKTLNGKIECSITKNTYQARTAQANSNNGIQPSAFIVDEIGAMQDYSNVNAMKSGQLSVINPLIFKITTAYAEDKSIMLEELDYLKKIYSGTEIDHRLFALLYYADEVNLWTDEGIEMSNPLRIERNYDEIKRSRDKALAKESERVEYLTKHVNHFLPSFSGEEFIDINKLKECIVDKVDFSGRDVYLGLDLSMTTDNVAVTIVALDDDRETILMDSWAFIPSNKVEHKSRVERTNYRSHITRGNCFACGDDVIDYGFVEKFVMDLEFELNCNIISVGYDRYNCMSTAQKLEANSMDTVEIPQHSSVLHPGTKLLEEKILQKKFKFEDNPLLIQNFQNAKVKEDTNKNKYIHKKNSNGKVDMVAAGINALYLLQQNELLSDEFVYAII